MLTSFAKRFTHTIGVVVVVLSLLLLPAVGAKVSAVSLYSTPAEVGFIDHVFGAAVKAEPSADVPESKLWFNDGLWWGAMFDQASSSYWIYRLDWATQTWVKTDTALENRTDTGTTEISSRFDTLWDEDANKLYMVSHIKLDNPSQVNNDANVGKLYRYSYNATSQTYILDPGFPASVNQDKTEALVLDKDSGGRLWTAYVSRVPVGGTPTPPQTYHVWVSYSTNIGTDTTWQRLNLSTLDATAATVDIHDVASVIAFGDKVGVMWSNHKTGKFYFATNNVDSSPASGWSIVEVAPTNLGAGIPLIANDHIHMVANSKGEVFSTIKTHNDTAPEPNDNYPWLGVIARSTTGTFTYHPFSDVSSLDTRPTLVYNDSNNKLIMFAASNAAGGVICYKEATVPTNLANLQFPSGNCSDSAGSGAPHFIRSSTYHNVDNISTTKRNINNNSGLVGIATDDTNGSVYLHNFLGSPLARITGTDPVEGATVATPDMVVSLTFDQEIKADTLTPANFKVTGPDGAVAGTIAYDNALRKATFTTTGTLVNGAYEVELTTSVKDAANRSLYNTGTVLTFTVDIPVVPPTQIVSSSPLAGATVTTPNLVVSLTFDQAIDAATLTPENFTVTGPDGALAGTIAYDAPTMTATFTPTAAPVNGSYTVALSAGVRDALGRPLAQNGDVLQFTVDIPPVVVGPIKIFLPSVVR